MNDIPDPFAELIARTREQQRSESEKATRITRRPDQQADRQTGQQEPHSPNHHDRYDRNGSRDNQLPVVHGNVANLFSAFISLFLFLLFLFCGLGAFIATCFWR